MYNTCTVLWWWYVAACVSTAVFGGFACVCGLCATFTCTWLVLRLKCVLLRCTAVPGSINSVTYDPRCSPPPPLPLRVRTVFQQYVPSYVCGDSLLCRSFRAVNGTCHVVVTVVLLPLLYRDVHLHAPSAYGRAGRVPGRHGGHRIAGIYVPYVAQDTIHPPLNQQRLSFKDRFRNNIHEECWSDAQMGGRRWKD